MEAVRLFHQVLRAEMALAAAPARVFPLLCPVREAEWLPGWHAEVLHSASGLAELGCVFRTRDEGGRDRPVRPVPGRPLRHPAGYRPGGRRPGHPGGVDLHGGRPGARPRGLLPGLRRGALPGPDGAAGRPSGGFSGGRAGLTEACHGPHQRPGPALRARPEHPPALRPDRPPAARGPLEGRPPQPRRGRMGAAGTDPPGQAPALPGGPRAVGRGVREGPGSYRSRWMKDRPCGP